jgi:hypothetical protein
MSIKQTHFATYDTPSDWEGLKFILALCEEPIADPVILHAWDSLPTGTKLDLAGISSINNCGKCLKKLAGQSGTIFAIKAAEALRALPVRERGED